MTGLQDQKMIDKYIIKFLTAIDNFFAWLGKLFTPKRQNFRDKMKKRRNGK